MPTIILSKVASTLDGSMKKKAYAFLEKLQQSDETPGLHIEPIHGADPRVRTGKVDDNYRCVMFKLTGSTEPAYVVHGIWKHDEANRIAERVRLSVNRVNGVTEVLDDLQAAGADAPPAPPVTETAFHGELGQVEEVPQKIAEPSSATTSAPVAEPPPAVKAAPTLRWSNGVDLQALLDLGIDKRLASRAWAAPDEDALAAAVSEAPVEWQGLALVDLATGSTLDRVRETYELRSAALPESGEVDDERVLEGIRTRAGQASFHWVEDDEELRRVIEAGDFGKWRIFLHPEQRRYVEGNYNGPYRLSGGAGTGKTVVAVHRARRLAAADPTKKVLLTTFTANLAEDIAAMLRELDSSVPQPTRLGDPGVVVKTLDSVSWSVAQRAGADLDAAMVEVLGAARSAPLKSPAGDPWRAAVAESDAELPPELTDPAFFRAEYSMVVLPGRLREAREYLRARRSGRGLALNRARRMEVWKVIEQYRKNAVIEGWMDFEERAAVAAQWLEQEQPGWCDHVVVDEAQDLTPVKLQLLRALVPSGPNDLFIAEDSHQRIYGQKVTLSSVGIQVRGRARRLTLNYRTTQQNLDFAMGVLEGGDFTDLEGAAEEHDYLSVRTGPVPQRIQGSSASEQLDGIAEAIRGWLPVEGAEADGTRASAPETIAVLVRDRYQRAQVVTALGERELDVRAVDREAVRPGMPLVMTMHRAKGLEFTHVVLVDALGESRAPVGAPDGDEDRDLRERSLTYVAATRARDVLAVVG